MLKKIVVILIIVCLFPLPALASDSWSKNDIYRELAYSAIVAIDIKQTQSAMREPRYKEVNPVLGSHPSDRAIEEHLLSVLVGHVLVSHYLSSENRKIFQDVSLIIGATNIIHNHSVGVRIDF